MGETTAAERQATPVEEEEIRGYTNVFEALDLPDPELLQAKSHLSIALDVRMRDLGLTQAEAAERAGLTQSDVSLIIRGRLARFSLERLMRAVNALGMDVEVVVHPPGEGAGQSRARWIQGEAAAEERQKAA